MFDEIISIEEVGIMETIDISVDSEERLFYANDILTHNSGYNKESVDLDSMADSMAIAHTADLVISLTQTEEDRDNSNIRFEITKSRLSRKGLKGIIGVNYDTLSIVNNLNYNTSAKQDDDDDAKISKRIDVIKKSKKEEIITDDDNGIS